MREILFRGKSYTDNKWHYGYFFYQFSTPVCPERYEITDRAGLGWNCPKETIGQFTGEKEFTSDENGNVTRGKRIFDGDIVRIESTEDGNGEFLVAWDDEKSGWQFKHLRGTRGTDCPDAIKVIGNRWDTPELLGAGE